MLPRTLYTGFGSLESVCMGLRGKNKGRRLFLLFRPSPIGPGEAIAKGERSTVGQRNRRSRGQRDQKTAFSDFLVPKFKGTPAWVEPRISCQIRFPDWTKGGQMLYPMFLSFKKLVNPNPVRRGPSAGGPLGGQPHLQIQPMCSFLELRITDWNKSITPRR